MPSQEDLTTTITSTTMITTNTVDPEEQPPQPPPIMDDDVVIEKEPVIVKRAESELDRHSDPFAQRKGKTLVWKDINMTLVSYTNCNLLD